MLRHGYTKSAIPWKEVKKDGLHGIWMICDEEKKPDVVVYYCHGEFWSSLGETRFTDENRWWIFHGQQFLLS